MVELFMNTDKKFTKKPFKRGLIKTGWNTSNFMKIWELCQKIKVFYEALEYSAPYIKYRQTGLGEYV